jgi:ABC-type transport system involved in multi-copper enzyme maturation permease subunit
MIFGALSVNVTNWLTPIWLIGVGALAGLAILAALWLVVYLVSLVPPFSTWGASGGGPASVWLRPLMVLSRRSVTEVPAIVREGFLWPFFWIVVTLASFGILGVLVVDKPWELLASLQRIPATGTSIESVDVPVSEPVDPEDEFSELETHTVPVQMRASEFWEIRFKSDQSLSIGPRPFDDLSPGGFLELMAGEQATWLRSEGITEAFPNEEITKLFVRNLGSETAHLQMVIVTRPAFPEVVTIPITALGIVAVFLLYLLQCTMAPRVSAVALATYKSEIAQPLFTILLLVGIVAVLVFLIMPYNTFGEDIKMLKDSGLQLIMVFGIVQAVWAASTSISEEIEGRTALTVLSKPIGRRSFIIGKFLGIVWTVAVLFLVLGLWFLLFVAYKPIFDDSSATADVTWQLCHFEMASTVPGLLLAFMETIVLAALSVAISTRMPMLANFVICATIYVLGHLTPLIVQSSMGQFVFVKFFGQLIATIFPVLDHFNIQAAVSSGIAVSAAYLFWSLVYCFIYSLIAMLLALVLFEDRDLA